MADIHQYDIGTNFILTIKDEDGQVVDISDATRKELDFRKSDYTYMTKTPEFFTDGTDGKLKYTTIEGDLSMYGAWRIQVYVELPDGKWYTSTEDFMVLPSMIKR